MIRLRCHTLCKPEMNSFLDTHLFQVSELAVYLADSSHCVILVVSILATLLGFLR